jgi:hypothetical protein
MTVLSPRPCFFTFSWSWSRGRSGRVPWHVQRCRRGAGGALWQDRIPDDLHAGDAREMTGVLREHGQPSFQGSGSDPGVGRADGFACKCQISFDPRCSPDLGLGDGQGAERGKKPSQSGIGHALAVGPTSKLLKHLPRHNGFCQMRAELQQTVRLSAHTPHVDKHGAVGDQSHQAQASETGRFISFPNCSNSSALRSGNSAAAARAESKSKGVCVTSVRTGRCESAWSPFFTKAGQS